MSHGRIFSIIRSVIPLSRTCVEKFHSNAMSDEGLGMKMGNNWSTAIRTMFVFTLFVHFVIFTVAACEDPDHDDKCSCDGKVPKINSILELGFINIDEKITSATPYWMFIVRGKEDKKRLLEFIRERAVSKKKKNEWREVIKKIWKKYPIELKNGIVVIDRKGNAENKDIQLTNEDQNVLSEIGQEMHRTMEESLNTEIIVKWAEPQHKTIIRSAVEQEGFYQYALVAEAEAGMPDQDPILQHQYYHSYDPTGIGFGGAPEACQSTAIEAKSLYLNGDKEEAFKKLGYSSHFLTDVGNPMHTGAGNFQIAMYFVNDIHNAYENKFVDPNWAIFQDSVEHAGDAIITSSPSESVKKLAGYSHKNLNYIILSILLNFEKNDYKFDFTKDPELTRITRDCLAMTTRYTRGLVRYLTTIPPNQNYKLFNAFETAAKPTGQIIQVYQGSLNWNGIGRVYLTGSTEYSTTWADDAFDVSSSSGSLSFTRCCRYYEGIPDITPILRSGTNQLTVKVRDIYGYSIGSHETWIYFSTSEPPVPMGATGTEIIPLTQELPSTSCTNATEIEQVPEMRPV